MKKAIKIIIIFTLLVLCSYYASAATLSEQKEKWTNTLSDTNEENEKETAELAKELYEKGAKIEIVRLIPIKLCDNCFVMASFPVDFAQEGGLNYDLVDFEMADFTIIQYNATTDEPVINETIEPSTNITEEPPATDNETEEATAVNETAEITEPAEKPAQEETAESDTVLEIGEEENTVIVLE